LKREKLRPWWYRPAPRAREQRVVRRRIYILPTRNGLLMVLVLGAMLLGAMNYGNSLVYGLTFLLTSVSVVSIIHTHRNLADLVVRTGQSRPVFAGEVALFPLAVENPGADRVAISFELENGRTTADLPEHSLHWIELRRPVEQRGWCELPRVTITSSFPLGLFRAWSFLELDQRCLVYPRPEQNGPPLPTGGGDEEHWERGRTGAGREDFSALRDYRAGDSLRHVHWKALAREQGLLTKEYEGSGRGHLLFEWDTLSGLPPEARLSRLCRWVLLAEASGLRYGLALPGGRLAPGRGESHRQRCLEALALFGAAP
jgi:uncharacterized protein (DUF58 family)